MYVVKYDMEIYKLKQHWWNVIKDVPYRLWVGKLLEAQISLLQTERWDVKYYLDIHKDSGVSYIYWQSNCGHCRYYLGWKSLLNVYWL